MSGGHMVRGSVGGGRGARGSSAFGEDAEILEVTEKHGPLYNAIPCMPLPVAIILCILNIVIPGFGTLLSSFTCLCGCKSKLGKPVKAFGLNILSALLQMVSFLVIVGWVWSIIWGMNFVQISSESKKTTVVNPHLSPQSSTANISGQGCQSAV